MPFRKITLSDGRERSRDITDIHPDGKKFLPEDFSFPLDDSERSLRIYELLGEIIKKLKHITMT